MADSTTDLKSIFGKAIEIESPAERQAYLEQVCAGNPRLRSEVDAILQSQTAAKGFFEGFRPVPAVTIDAPISECPGTMIGPYKLLQQIGEGGMGTVYMAEQLQPIQRKVALKIIKAGMDSKQVIARFEAERQALAMMDHVNIARVFDGGTTESGRPYFVMELVNGVPITKYCDDNHLTLRERLELFVPVCQAIQHAHQKGIIHRDIKPSNVMITLYDGKPVPKVIDFGVAKATEQKLTERTLFTQYGTMIGTLEYMSPEQAEMSALGVDTRSDIFSLGVLLYELLTGSTPLSHQRLKEAAYGEILRMIREEDAPKPSTRLSDLGEALASISARRHTEPAKLSKLMRGELDWIVMKTLEKDRNRRYETANGFAADVQRYLNDEQVQACPASAWYRFRKFARRNKAGLSITSLILFLIILLGVGVGWTVRDRAARQAKRNSDALLALERVERLQDQGKGMEARAALEHVEALADEVPLESALQQRLAALKENLITEAQDRDLIARLEEIRLVAQSQVNVQESRFTEEDAFPKISEALRAFGIEIGVTTPASAVARIQGRSAAVRGLLVVALHECLVHVLKQGNSYREWLVTVLGQADGDAWRTQVRQACAAGEQGSLAQLAAEVDVDRQPPAILLWLAGQLPAGGPARLELIGRTQNAYPADLWANLNLARALQVRHRRVEAIRYLTAAVALRPHNAGVYLNRAVDLDALNEWDAAIVDLRRAIALAPQYSSAHYNLGNVLRKKGDVNGAIACYRKAIELDPKRATAHTNLGVALDGQRKLDEAIACYRAAIELDPKLAEAHSNLGIALSKQGKLEEAIAGYRQAIQLDPKYAAAHYNLGNALRDQKKLDEAIAGYRKAIQLDPKFAAAHHNLGNALLRQGRLDEALAARRKAVELLPRDAMANNGLAWLLATCSDAKLADPAHAVELAKKAVELEPKSALYWKTLGVAEYRAGDWKAAIAALEKVKELGSPGDSMEWFPLAMAHWQLGEKEEARKWYDRAVAWMDKNSPKNDDLRRFREEAAKLLNLEEQPKSVPISK